MTRILLIQGHPHPASDRRTHRLERAYVEGATQGGHQIRTLSMASLDLSSMRDKSDLDRDELLPLLQAARDDIAWAEHIVLFSPFWLGSTPNSLKAMLAQLAHTGTPADPAPASARTARVVLTTGMPALFSQLVFRAFSPKAIRRHVLNFVGMGRVHETLVGGGSLVLDRWVRRLRDMGRMAA